MTHEQEKMVKMAWTKGGWERHVEHQETQQTSLTWHQRAVEISTLCNLLLESGMF